MTEIPSIRIGAQAGENVRKNFFLNYKSDSETPIAIFNKPSSGRGGPPKKGFLNIKDSGLGFNRILHRF
jgi:hypothetical protein